VRVLEKKPVPAVLEKNGEAWLNEYLADPNSDTKRYRYREKTIKTALLAETGDKCVYCESKIGQNTPGDVEHKVPSSKDRKQHFTWENLTIACTECNRRKRDYYEVDDAFLDPYVDDVERCLVHLGPFIHWVPGHSRAEKAVRMLELDSMKRKSLIDRKIDVLEKVRALLNNQKTADGALLQAMRKDEVLRMGKKDAEYSAMVLTYLKQVGES
jgi:hypothetical protein